MPTNSGNRSLKKRNKQAIPSCKNGCTYGKGPVRNFCRKKKTTIRNRRTSSTKVRRLVSMLPRFMR